MTIRIAAVSVVLACSGCASVVNDSTHPMKVETKAQSGELVAGAECKLTNDYGTITVKSGDTTQVRRSSKALDILCEDPNNPNANARAISRANGGMWGNIILGGGIGARGGVHDSHHRAAQQEVDHEALPYHLGLAGGAAHGTSSLHVFASSRLHVTRLATVKT